MAIYSLSMNGTVAGSGVPSWEAKPSAANEPAIMEIGVINGAATACTYGFGRGGAVSTQTGGVLVLAEDEGRPTGLTSCAIAWSVAPTVPANYFRRMFLPATIGAGCIFTFPRGIVLAQGGAGLVQWNIAASSASTAIHCVCDE
jgi:hypothetical protein